MHLQCTSDVAAGLPPSLHAHLMVAIPGGQARITPSLPKSQLPHSHTPCSGAEAQAPHSPTHSVASRVGATYTAVAHEPWSASQPPPQSPSAVPHQANPVRSWYQPSCSGFRGLLRQPTTAITSAKPSCSRFRGLLWQPPTAITSTTATAMLSPPCSRSESHQATTAAIKVPHQANPDRPRHISAWASRAS
jgi:hypothetical protein